VVNFQNNSSGSSSFQWDFGNGNLSNLTSPVATYTTVSQTRVFTTTLMATSVFGCSDSVDMDITVHPSAVASFSSNTLRGCTPLGVGFSNTSFDYDNLLYIVAGEVVARVSGMSWEDYVQTQILNPLEMNKSYSSISRIKDKSNLATPHSTENGKIKTISPFEEMANGAAGGIISNVNDLCNWMLVQLNNGKYGDNLEKQIFSEDRQKEMWKIHSLLPVNNSSRYNSHFAGYGLGWMLSDINGKMKVSHTGGLPGMLSITVLIPDLDFGIVILTNTANGGGGVSRTVSQTIIDSYLGLDEFNWLDHYYQFYQKKENKGDKVSAQVWEKIKTANSKHVDLKQFIGVYEDNWFGKIEVLIKRDKLWFKSYRSPKLNGQMFFYNANTFAIKWEYQDMNADAFAMFNLDEEGKAQSLKMKGISPNIDFSFDFQDLDLKRIK